MRTIMTAEPKAHASAMLVGCILCRVNQQGKLQSFDPISLTWFLYRFLQHRCNLRVEGSTLSDWPGQNSGGCCCKGPIPEPILRAKNARI